MNKIILDVIIIGIAFIGCSTNPAISTPEPISVAYSVVDTNWNVQISLSRPADLEVQGHLHPNASSYILNVRYGVEAGYDDLRIQLVIDHEEQDLYLDLRQIIKTVNDMKIRSIQ